MKNVDRFVFVAAIAANIGLTGAAHAGGFGILSQSVSALGNAFAGGAAAGEDASTVWYNPAGMGRLSGFNASTALHIVKPSAEFQNTASTGAFALPGTGEGGNGGGVAGVPQGYVVSSLGDNWRLGVGFNAPFGLKTEYNSGWRGQVTALKSEATAFNLNPSAAYKINDSVWLGAGLSVQRFSTVLTNFAGPLGNARLKASDTGWGFNLGALFDASKDTRVGIAYRSKIHFKPSGNATFTSGAGVFDSAARTDLTVPETASVNVVTNLPPDWEVMGGATWTRWSRLQNLTVTRTTASALGPAGSVVTTLPFNWRNTVLLAAGANYKVSDAWKLRFGAAYDPAVSNDVSRTARLPDQSRVLVALGAQLKPDQGGEWKNWTFDFAYGHEFIKDARISNNVAGVPGTLVGKFQNNANVVSFQANYGFRL